ncbi:unnamed protein product [Clonostachys rosea]|uniref:Heterokaryon incompatibility domain-containing protein n=1 Tax=Bionectria ochroleuca TaxID=29856 RepID=A0ABY6UTP4_BIOOC|nr:unnamed protein product [Clonostachys rosea]
MGLGNEVVRVFRPLSKFQYSAKSGCDICSVIVGASELWNAAAAAPNLALNIPVTEGNFELSFWLCGEEISLQFYTQGGVWNRVHPLPDISCGDVLSEGIDFARSCLNECLINHETCRSTRNSPPSRLLDVGTASNTSIQLVDTETMLKVEYTALSYCWGDSVTLKTTVANLERIKSGTPLKELPQTYVDAVLLTRSLGIRYLWIDALCIVQDWVDDWVKESANMSNIYGHAVLVLAASSSESAKRGFLSRESTKDTRDHRTYSRQFGSDRPVIVKARRLLEVGVHWTWRESRPEHTPREPLALRGWTLQEQLLSTRYLSFSLGELQWSCQELTTCECRSKLNHRRQFGKTPLSQISEHRDAFRFWNKMIENYSTRRLTKQSDTLPAISGVAEKIQRITGSPYVAGLWANNIYLDLLWRLNPSSTEPQVSEYIAPSFSWASIRGEIDYYCYRNGKVPYSPACFIEAANTQLATNNAHLGAVEQGTLKIHGKLMQTHVVRGAEDGWFYIELFGSEVELRPDTPLDQVLVTGAGGKTELTLRRRQEKDVDSSRSMHAERLGSSETHVWLLQLGSFPDGDDRRDHELLVLGKVSENPLIFQRLGLLSWLEDAPVQGHESLDFGEVTTLNII